MGAIAYRRKMAKKVKVGDLVTWGRGVASCPVLEVHHDGVLVDTGPNAACGPRLFVTWEGGRPGKGEGLSRVRVVRKP